MNLQQIETAFHSNGHLHSQARDYVEHILRTENAYDAITLVADCAIRELAPAIAACLDSPDAMVRWNATATLFTRFRMPLRLDRLLQLASRDETDGMVRGVALCGIGEVLPFVSDEHWRTTLADALLAVLLDSSETSLVRGAAYDGILAAINVPPLERPAANKILDFVSDIDTAKLGKYRKQYGCE